ncbi:histidinol-phosphate transaminase [Poseidonocella sedimentorum]|uniref:Histidinol-phosphate aminotransferase n=1 Tax=Poseidonocella sedimentorum TaxID=871652 RepID=A0A1I6DXI0_9RHOB|nr:histidinol-phosphate transaminase [Poseidonocella sedimentorum]SFR10224.1 histidinol-phosphate aminotransferase [Poseidonocella sedimentorum]
MAPIAPQPGIMEIALYQGGQSRLEGMTEVVKLSANENPYGPSPSARAAYAAAAETLHRYPGTTHEALRAAIGEVQGVDPDRVICGVGSDEVLQFICQAYAGPGDEVIHTEHGFSMYPILARAVGATPVCVAERERVVDVDAIVAACSARTRIVFLTNPGNPTGTMIGAADIARLADGLAGRAILVIDAAYADFIPGFDGGASLVEARDNVVMTRTFSKIYGLGGLRIGWGYGPRAIIDVLNRIRQPFNLSPTQLDTAEAAVRDKQWTAYCRDETARLRSWLRAELIAAGIAVDESHTNFILARFASPAQAQAADAALKAEGLIVRAVAGYGFPEGLRITIGDERACGRVADVLRSFMEGQG